MRFRDRCPRLFNACRGLRGESLLTIDEHDRDIDALRAALRIARKERDEIAARHEELVAECTRHRHATWEISHK
jgi:hypothetical protein